MKLIIGLGNPSEKYKHHRHNVGYMAIDALASEIRNSKSEIRNKPQILIFKSENFMNESGETVKKLVDQYKIDLSNLWVVYDDLDILLGSYKIQFGKGPKEHNGLNDIYEKLNTKDFWHIRIGVENRKTHGEPSGYDYVLEDFSNEELKKLRKVIDEVCKKLATS